jgi:hypothetical protein
VQLVRRNPCEQKGIGHDRCGIDTRQPNARKIAVLLGFDVQREARFYGKRFNESDFAGLHRTHLHGRARDFYSRRPQAQAKGSWVTGRFGDFGETPDAYNFAPSALGCGVMSQAETRAKTSEPSASASPTGEVTLLLSDIETGLSALPRAKVARYVAWGGTAAVVAMVAYRWVQGYDRKSLVIVAVILLVLLASSRNPAKRIAKRVYASLPEDAKRLRIAVSEQEFCVTSSGNESLLPWSDVRRCVEARNAFVVFVSQHDAQILPKRGFSASDLQAIREWSRTKIVKRDEPWLTPQLRLRLMVWLAVFALVWIAWTYFGHR